MSLPHLTVAYFTNRKNPQINWFFDSLRRETGGDWTGIKVLVIDYWAGLNMFGHPESNRRTSDCQTEGYPPPPDIPCEWHAPKPSVWQGAFRLTKADYFAAANARNTALCLAPDGWIAFIDDVSLPMPGWLAAVREAMAGNYIVAGAYRKVKKMQVENGVLKFCEGFPGGEDTRWWKGSDTAAVPCEIFPEWTYGCSLAGPIEAFLTIGGYPEVADGLGYEDSVVGFMLKNNGYSPANGLRYDRRMLTYESDELHAQYPRFLREDPCRGDPLAIPRDDMSHALLRLLCPLNSHPGYFGEEGIRGLRRRIQAGNRFSSVGIPEHRWFDSKPLRDLPENPADAIPLPYYDEAKA